jgi:uncharacterized protein (UPF0212 family)
MKSTSKTNSAVLDPEPAAKSLMGLVYCPMCTHSVRALIEPAKRGFKAVAHQKCPRCGGKMDAAVVLRAEPS